MMWRRFLFLLRFLSSFYLLLRVKKLSNSTLFTLPSLLPDAACVPSLAICRAVQGAASAPLVGRCMWAAWAGARGALVRLLGGPQGLFDERASLRPSGIAFRSQSPRSGLCSFQQAHERTVFGGHFVSLRAWLTASGQFLLSVYMEGESRPQFTSERPIRTSDLRLTHVPSPWSGGPVRGRAGMGEPRQAPRPSGASQVC